MNSKVTDPNIFQSMIEGIFHLFWSPLQMKWNCESESESENSDIHSIHTRQGLDLHDPAYKLTKV
jgi:hypothetical protein